MPAWIGLIASFFLYIGFTIDQFTTPRPEAYSLFQRPLGQRICMITNAFLNVWASLFLFNVISAAMAGEVLISAQRGLVAILVSFSVMMVGIGIGYLIALRMNRSRSIDAGSAR